ncbi:YbaB/EbfC family nucleoid-associated protein (plasmid) [Streptomyces sp. AHU1]|uniref:YbaB/EbfC family nucleoid-associated protein n=1 Tax=Streptomyces sp. AHU1 TaxID=3377215 RepID=UPI003877BD5F
MDEIGEKLVKAMEQLESTQKAVQRAEKELKTSSVTIRSKDLAVEVTVGAQGDLTGLRFLGDKYRSMSGSQLSSSILDAALEGRQIMARKVVSTFSEIAESERTLEEFGLMDFQWERVFGPEVLEGGESMSGGRSGGRVYRDEIIEDGEG